LQEQPRKPKGDRTWRSYMLNLTFGAQFAGVDECTILNFGASSSEPFPGSLGSTLSGARRAAAAFMCSHRARSSIARNRRSSETSKGIQDSPPKIYSKYGMDGSFFPR